MAFIGEIFALIAAFGWVGSSVMFERASKKLSGLSVNIIRLVIAMLLLMIITTFTRGMALPFDATSKMAFYLGISGMMGLFIGDFFLYQAYTLIGARITLVLMTLAPIVVSILGFLFLGETLTFQQIIGILITCTGVTLVILKNSGDNKKLSINFSKKGLIFAILAVTGEAIGIIFTKIGSANYDSFATTQVRSIPALLAFIFFISLKGEWKSVAKAATDRLGVLYITLGTIIATVGMCSLIEGMRHTKMGVVTTIASTSPILIIPISIIFFKEKITKREMIGAGVSVVGVALFFL